MDATLVKNCRSLLEAYRSGNLGQTVMPEDTNPSFANDERESRLAYFTLPMALNYQRNSYALWEAALATWNDPDTRDVFDVQTAASMDIEELRQKLTKHKLALQPNKHVSTWQAIAGTVAANWGSISAFIDANGRSFRALRDLVQGTHKKGFPYLSGPKIFNYWSFILGAYGNVRFDDGEWIDIAPDTHITQCSVRLGVISGKEAEHLSKDEISQRWREMLHGSGINPIDMHPPLWFWSRNGFLFALPVSR